MIKINWTEQFITQQVKCLDMLTELIEFDKQHGDPPEKARVLEGFIDTQRRALDMAAKLLEKHKPALEEAEKAEREKQQAQEKIEAAKRREESKKTQVKEDLKKATTDEGSLFCAFGDEAAKDVEETEVQEQELDEDSAADDGYGFEENDDDED